MPNTIRSHDHLEIQLANVVRRFESRFGRYVTESLRRQLESGQRTSLGWDEIHEAVGYAMSQTQRDAEPPTPDLATVNLSLQQFREGNSRPVQEWLDALSGSNAGDRSEG